MEKVEVRFEPWLRQAFALYRGNFALLLLTHLVLVSVSVFTFGILAGPMFAGAARLVLDLLNGKEPKPQAGDLFKGFDYFLPSCLLGLSTLAAGVFLAAFLKPLGVLALAGPIFVATATYYAIFLIVERDLEFWPSVQASWIMARSNFWPLLGLVAFGLLAGTSGSLALGVGVVVTFPFYTCLAAVAWRNAGGEAEPAEPFTRVPTPPYR